MKRFRHPACFAVLCLLALFYAHLTLPTLACCLVAFGVGYIWKDLP